MATITLKGIGINQFGGVTSEGNVTTLRATLKTNAAGAPIDANSAAAIAIGDKLILQSLPKGMLLEDAQVIISTAMTASVTGSLGFEYADGVDSAVVPQDAAYFGAGLVLSSAARLRCATAKAPVVLEKTANLILTTAGVANAKVSQLDFIVHGERL